MNKQIWHWYHHVWPFYVTKQHNMQTSVPKQSKLNTLNALICPPAITLYISAFQPMLGSLCAEIQRAWELSTEALLETGVTNNMAVWDAPSSWLSACIWFTRMHLNLHLSLFNSTEDCLLEITKNACMIDPRHLSTYLVLVKNEHNVLFNLLASFVQCCQPFQNLA